MLFEKTKLNEYSHKIKILTWLLRKVKVTITQDQEQNIKESSESTILLWNTCLSTCHRTIPGMQISDSTPKNRKYSVRFYPQRLI